MYNARVRIDILNKIFLLIITAALTAAAVCGCADDPKKSSSEEASASSQTTEASEEATAEVTAPPVVKHDIKPADGTYVYDYAKLLSGADFDECNNYAGWLYEKYLINAAVVTTDNLDGMTPEQYAENAYIDIYSGRGSGLLLLINNDTNEDHLYKKGSCLTFVDESEQSAAFYWATQDMVKGDFKNAVMRIMQLGEACPQHIFDNGGIFSTDEISLLESACAESNISVLATSNSTSSTNEEICRSYYDRRYKNEEGFMIMLDSATNTLIVCSDSALPEGFDAAVQSANELAAAQNYVDAVNSLITALKG